MHLKSQNRKTVRNFFFNRNKFHNSIKKRCHSPLTRFEAIWPPPGAKEDELDPLPWLNVSALVSLSAFLCSLFIYKIIKRRQDILWATGSHLQQKLIFTRGIKFSKRNLARSVFPGRASSGFSLATTFQGSRAQQMGSFIIISFGLFHTYAGKLSWYMQGNFRGIYAGKE